jgi:ABC-type bacteriocin/lantibiotic exporter with double-glycine peptidase domain
LSGATLMGVVGALMYEFGGHAIYRGTMTPGQWFAFNAFLVLLIAPVFQIVAIGTQITEAITGLERTREILNEKKEDQDPRRTVQMDRIDGSVAMKEVSFSYDSGKEVLHSAGGAVGCGKIDHNWVDCRVLCSVARPGAGGWN